MRRLLFLAAALAGCGAYPPPPGWQGATGGGAGGSASSGGPSTQQPRVIGTQAVLPQSGGAWFSINATVYVPQGARNPKVQVSRDGRVVYEPPQTSVQGNEVQFAGAFGSDAVLLPTDTSESRPGQVYVTLEVRLMAEGAQPLVAQSLVALSCAADLPICGGACTHLLADADHCGACGNACPADSSGARGYCQSGGCTWPSFKSATPRSCDALCGSVQIGGQALGCVSRCGYDDQTGLADPEGGFDRGFTRRNNGSRVVIEPMFDCAYAPQSSNANGAFVEQGCCCGFAPVDD